MIEVPISVIDDSVLTDSLTLREKGVWKKVLSSALRWKHCGPRGEKPLNSLFRCPWCLSQNGTRGTCELCPAQKLWFLFLKFPSPLSTTAFLTRHVYAAGSAQSQLPCPAPQPSPKQPSDRTFHNHPQSSNLWRLNVLF